MATSSFEIGSIVVLILAIGFVGWLLFLNWNWYNKAKNSAEYRSFELLQDGKSTAELKCPTNSEIKLQSLFVGSSNSGSAAASCYSALQNSPCKMPTTLYQNGSGDKSLANNCDGKNSYTVSVDDVKEAVRKSGRSGLCPQDGAQCLPNVFGVYECS